MTKNYTADPAAKTRVIVGAILLVLVWAMSAATVVALLIVLPDHQVDDYAFWIIAGGFATAVLGTLTVVNCVIHGQTIEVG